MHGRRLTAWVRYLKTPEELKKRVVLWKPWDVTPIGSRLHGTRNTDVHDRRTVLLHQRREVWQLTLTQGTWRAGGLLCLRRRAGMAHPRESACRRAHTAQADESRQHATCNNGLVFHIFLLA